MFGKCNRELTSASADCSGILSLFLSTCVAGLGIIGFCRVYTGIRAFGKCNQDFGGLRGDRRHCSGMALDGFWLLGLQGFLG